MSDHRLLAGGHWQSGGGSCRGSDLAGVGRVLASDPGPGLFPGRWLCLHVLTVLSLLSYRRGWGGQGSM